MSKAAELAALIGGQSSLAMPNMIINGDCRVAQRGTSTASITGNTNFVVDRWAFNPSGHGTWTLSQNSSTGLSEFETSVKMLCTTGGGSPAASDYVLMYYNIEGHDTQILKMGTSDAERFTVSFYVKSNKTGTGIVEAQTTSGGASVEYSRSFTISQANTWEKKSVTMIANTSLAQDSANKTTSTGLTLYFILDSGTNQTTGTLPTTWADQTFVNRWAGHDLGIGRNADDYMELTGLQVDIGDVAQAFKYESFEQNLARCQRYFRQIGTIRHQGANGDPCGQIIPLEPTMRVEPTVAGTNSTGGSHSIAGTGDFPNTQIIYSGTAATSGGTAFIQFTGVTADAEL